MKILVVSQSSSIHATRFVSLLQELGHDVRLFVCDAWYSQDEHLRNTTTYIAFPTQGNAPTNGNRLIVSTPWERVVPARQADFDRMCAEVPRVARDRMRQLDLVRVLERYQPDVVISARMQPEGYDVGDAKERMGDAFPCPWIHFCWGTDIEYFAKSPVDAPAHRPRIERALRQCDYLFADTKRDLRQAKDFGFRGTTLGAFLAPGGFDLAPLEAARGNALANRDVILVKGRQGHYVGRAMNAIKALEGMADRLRGYRVLIMMATPDVAAHVEGPGRATGIRYEVLGLVPYAELLNLYARTRISISASDVDGTPSFLVESMVMGALPIHSDMASVREWVDDGVNGLLFAVDDVDALRAQIVRGLDDDALCRTAAVRNWAIAQERMDRRTIREQIGACLKTVVAAGAARRPPTARRLRQQVLAGAKDALARLKGLWHRPGRR